MNTRIATFILILGSAASGGAQDFEIRRSSISAGGGNSAGGDFAVRGTTGQTLVGVRASGGNYAVIGGFWAGDSFADPDLLFRSGFEYAQFREKPV